jgi:hypothetical protein
MEASALASEPTLTFTEFTMGFLKGTNVTPIGGGRYSIVNEPSTFTQAGGHPWGLTTALEFASEEVETEEKGVIHKELIPTRDAKDVVVGLPPGLLGDPMAVPRCPLSRILSFSKEQCPDNTQIGVFRVQWEGGKEALGPIVNVAPEAGQSAEFAFEPEGKVPFLLTAHLVHNENGYGFTVASNGVPGTLLVRAETTFWGVPADPSHDALRGMFCSSLLRGETLRCQGGGRSDGGESLVPFLSMPTNCAAGKQIATIRADSWETPGRVREGQHYEGYTERRTDFPAVTGCNLLAFTPSIEVAPDTLVADEPVGLGVTLKVPQPETPQTNATPHLRDAVVTLPQGVSVNPGIVDGIQACKESGPEGINFEGPLSEEVGLNGELQLAAGHCPGASTVGTAEAITPLLPEPVKGHVYLAQPLCGGSGERACTEQDALDGNLYQVYLELGGTGELAETGIHIKAHGFVEANPATGQLTTKFLDNPQTPFSELHVELNGGPRASLANPATCGPASTNADFTPWSAPGTTPEGLSMPGTPDAISSSHFEVEGCATPPGLKPGFVAGTVTPQAAKFTDFTMNLLREDREQYVRGIQVHTPQGLLGMLSSVPLCEGAAAEDGTCPAASKIGTTRVATGAGSHPFEIEGNIYLTGPYHGAPFGLSVVTDAVAGPFNLGLVVVRARIQVDPDTSTLTITTDESGIHAIPRLIFGVPLRLRRVTVDIDRPGFMFNPTNCGSQRIEANILGSENSIANVSSPFAVTGCRSLAFKPKFTASTSGRTSRAKGASLDVKLSYPAGSVGNEANIAKTKVDLPRFLPSRLTTLQQACPVARFRSNPASCSRASIVGLVRATTPVLPVGLSGPVYFVSHGGEEFPSLVIVLEGDGVRVDLTGSTFIRKKVTSSTFRSVPDVPVRTFELYLPQGKNSALAANGNLCSLADKMKMPTEFVAQNGAVIKQSTKIQVTGCVKPKRQGHKK